MRTGLVSWVAAAMAAATAFAEVPARVPVEAFARDPLLESARLSPSGRYVAAVASKDDNRMIVVWDLTTGKRKPIIRFSRDTIPRNITVSEFYRLEAVHWANDDRILFNMGWPVAGVPGWNGWAYHLYGIERDGSDADILSRKWRGWPFIWEQHNFVSFLPDDPQNVLMSVHGKVYKVDVQSGRARLEQRDQPFIADWHADLDDRVRVGVGVRQNILRYVARIGPDDRLQEIFEGDRFEAPSFLFRGFSPDPAVLYVASDHEGDRLALYEYDLRTSSFGKRVFGHPEVDVDAEPWLSRKRRKLLAVPYAVERGEYHFLDDALRAHMARIDAALPDRVHRVTSMNTEEDRWLVRSHGPTHPPATYFYSPADGRLVKLFESFPELAEASLAPTRPVSFEARDGLRLRGYLTLPPGVEPQKLPVVLLVHGGPMARDTWGFDREVQLLANQGYAVLQINFRGSEGFGREFLTVGYGRWGLEMQDDLTDGARWLIERGVADPGRIGIYGASYGAYASLMALVKEPALFRCAAALAGLYDLTNLQAEEKWRGLHHAMGRVVGDGSNAGQLRKTSPALQADRIRAPVLLAHGREDWRINYAHAERMAAALEAAGVPHELLLLEDESHGLEFEHTRLRFYGRLVSFFDENLRPAPAPGAAGGGAAAPGSKDRPVRSTPGPAE